MHFYMYIKRKYLSAWHGFVLKRRAGCISLGRWLKRAVTDKLRRRLDTWHAATVRHTRRKMMCVETLFGISRKVRCAVGWHLVLFSSCLFLL